MKPKQALRGIFVIAEIDQVVLIHQTEAYTVKQADAT
jgi:hypothetical protein